ncbi:unnamed protein product [Kuraishia capsulata CBS 1993]|uniref:PH domain-containing protein n=1 Tax=Kuraishia capsulata CBS 1993 TaxID=1382522 RepID=W6ML78_9ASCO|nr:uncharacterized protein KUCA_T00003222001 [Kuraishia capsulata CBS 1993]CDK27244.1 unnamed protein product [Kuraishia capsulata CBS 1993]
MSLSRSGTWRLSSPPPANRVQPVSPTGVEAEEGGGAQTPLLDDSQPDSTELVARRYDKYIALLTSVENFTDNYLSLIAINVKQYEKIIKNLQSNVSPQFEVSPGADAPVSGSVAGSGYKQAVAGEGVYSPAGAGAAPGAHEQLGPVGLNEFLEALKVRTDMNHSAAVELDSTIRTQVLPEFKRIISEIQSRKKEFLSASQKEVKELKKLHGTTSKELAKLQNSVSSFDSSYSSSVGPKIDYRSDPYIIKRSVLHHGHEQLNKENSHFDFLESNEITLGIMEKQIVEILKKIFNNFSVSITNYLGKGINTFDDLNNQLAAIPVDYEWERFKERNAQSLISGEADPDSVKIDNDLSDVTSKLSLTTARFEITKNPYKRTLSDVVFPNQTHTATEPILEGVLLRREGKITKKYKSYYYVITRTRYLFEFQSRSFKDSHHPSLVMFLPECLVGNPSAPGDGKFKFTVQGKDISQLVSMTKKTVSFKASSYEEMLTWYNVISEVSGLMYTNEEMKSAAMAQITPDKSDDEEDVTAESIAPQN